MTATVTGRPPARHADRPARRARRATTTPATMRVLMVVLVLLSLAWGAFGGWATSQHSSAASTLISVDEPLSLDASGMYEKIADADVTITTAYLASSQPQLAPLQRYQTDIDTASADLARLRAGTGDPSLDASLAAQPLEVVDQRPALGHPPRLLDLVHLEPVAPPAVGEDQ